MEKKTKALQISIPLELHKQIKIECVKKGVSISKFMMDVVLKDIYKEENKN